MSELGVRRGKSPNSLGAMQTRINQIDGENKLRLIRRLAAWLIMQREAAKSDVIYRATTVTAPSN
jgi:hypothetical protein